MGVAVHVTLFGFLASGGISENRTGLLVSVDGVGWTDKPARGYLSSPGCCFHTESSKGAHVGQDQHISPTMDGGSVQCQTQSPSPSQRGSQLCGEQHTHERGLTSWFRSGPCVPRGQLQRMSARPELA